MTAPTLPTFRAGDTVTVLYQGRYDGIPGRFVRLREDPNWADIEELDGAVRAHPVVWLRRDTIAPQSGPEDIYSPK